MVIILEFFVAYNESEVLVLRVIDLLILSLSLLSNINVFQKHLLCVVLVVLDEFH